MKKSMDLFRHFYDYYGKVVLSIGSGLGVFENACKREIILVDPDPYDFVRKTRPNDYQLLLPKIEQFINPPHYATIDEFLEKRPECKKEVPVLINWSDPGPFDNYDMIAIIKLHPPAIFIIFDECGHAGSSGLHTFYNIIMGDRNPYKCYMPGLLSDEFYASKYSYDAKEEMNQLAADYRLVHRCTCKPRYGNYELLFSMVWLERIDRPLVFRPPDLDHFPTILPCNIVFVS